jgi:hypothetical protein
MCMHATSNVCLQESGCLIETFCVLAISPLVLGGASLPPK